MTEKTKVKYGVHHRLFPLRTYVHLGDQKTSIINGFYGTRKTIGFGYHGDNIVNIPSNVEGMSTKELKVTTMITFEDDAGIDNLVAALLSLKEQVDD